MSPDIALCYRHGDDAPPNPAAESLSAEDRQHVIRYMVRKLSDSQSRLETSSITDAMNDTLAGTVKRVRDIRQMLTRNRLRVALQPIVFLADRRIHHYEALARPTDGEAPAGLIGFAEEIGLSADFDLLMCRKVIDILTRGADSGSMPSIALNISAASLESEQFVEAFRKLLAGDRRLRDNLLIEVTESMRIRDLESTNAALGRLRGDGHKVCLDDFGAGASSLHYIRALEVDFVKIDGAYVKRLEFSARDRAILKAMASLCAELDVGIVAEMIETEAQAEILAGLGVQLGQGHLFGKPSLDVAFAPVAATQPATSRADRPGEAAALACRRSFPPSRAFELGGIG